MKAKLNDYVKRKRSEQGLNYAQLAERMGYANPTKGMNRIIRFEREGIVHPDLLKKLIDVLNLDKDIVRELTLHDKTVYEKELEEWLNEPVKISYTIRGLQAFYLRYDLTG